jgi:hypothetical protein
MATTAVQSRGLSPYLKILEGEITEDLRTTIDPLDLRAEVRKVLFREVLRQAATALSEMDNAVSYDHLSDRIPIAEAKLGRHLGYVLEMLAVRTSQRIDPDHQLTEVSGG